MRYNLFRKIALKIAARLANRWLRRFKKTYPDTWYEVSYNHIKNELRVDAKHPAPEIRALLENRMPPGFLGCNIYLNLTH